ncbi:sugar phosphate isomerase/epimerase [Ahrensia sp. 13_GOM-1096m]|uniref:sugar phosphate isomerase/epimerase family protein n=1 Tax=Ahrensia sp. 13_GOM-1096m TaxID=1380380 RepID=UPI00047B53D4|nr:sugar phosphate isomerase/epimerase [Ahrensia sp. 13_GOM-1096m]
MTAISYQLYSSRNFGPISKTFEMLASNGYKHVEGYGALFTDSQAAAALKADLEKNGLTMPTAHMGLANLEDNPSECVAMAKLLDLKAAFVPHIEADLRPTDLAGWQAFGKRVQAALAPLKDAGLIVGWHNHDFEMQELGGGTTALDALLEGGPDLQAELDLAWVIKGGKDPIAFLEKYSSRIAAVHIKDIAPQGECADEDGWADVGHGTVEWAPIRDAINKTSNQYVVAEHDNPNDDKRFSSRSIATINTLWKA